MYSDFFSQAISEYYEAVENIGRLNSADGIKNSV